MDGHHRRTVAKWLGGIVLIVCLTFVGGQDTFTQDWSQVHPLGDIPLDPLEYARHVRVYPESTVAGLPWSYDAREVAIVTPAKDQMSCGSCWAFASVGAIESHLLKAFGYGPADLSEQQQVSCNTSMLGCSGGNSAAIRYWESTGPVEETCFPYTGTDSTQCKDGCEQLGYRVSDWHTVQASTDQFKNSLYTDGPSYWRFDVYADFYTYWSYGSPGSVYVHSSGGYVGGHAVLLIGWDDSRGAFLCKNSWGEADGPNGDGTFWIAYSGHTADLRLGMANFSLVSTVVCTENADCEDGEACTTDTCHEAGAPGAYCSNVWPACGLEDGCCGPDCTEQMDPDCKCGNGVCDVGEDCTSCPDDCIGGLGGSCDSCFKGACDGVCHPVKEGPECSDCAAGYCCGDGVCEGNEDSFNCAVDCGPPPECGDGRCDEGEDQCHCATDCGLPPSNESGQCTDGIDNDCDQVTDCADSDCNDDAACICRLRGFECTDNSDCCSDWCHRGKCK